MHLLTCFVKDTGVNQPINVDTIVNALHNVINTSFRLIIDILKVLKIFNFYHYSKI